MICHLKYWLIISGIAFALFSGASHAIAAEPPDLPPGLTCDHVRESVRRYGKVIAIIVAKANGATHAQIEEAKKCLK